MLGGVAASQSQPEFEVAAIKPSAAPPDQPRILIQGGTLTAEASLRALIEYAYQIVPIELEDVPGWFESETWAITAKGNPNTTSLEVRMMLRPLLAERFRLVLKTESRERSVSVLVVRDAEKVAARMTRVQAGPQPMWFTNRGEDRNRVRFRSFSMRSFTALLARQLERIVVDETGLEGEFDFEYDAPKDEESKNQYASRLAATVSELGLRLESRKQPATIYAIVGAQLPSDN